MEYVRLGDVCSKIGSGATPTGGKEAYQGGGYKLVRSQNVLDLEFSWDGLAEINEQQARKLNNVEVNAGDVLLNITGDSVARSCVAPKTIIPARVNQHVAIIRPVAEILNNYYLLCYLQVNKQYLLALASTGGTRNALTKQMIEKLQIALPALPIQQKIASILSTYDNLIENNTKRIKLLEQMAENLYKEWFVRFRFPGHENVEMENGLPKGWNLMALGDIILENPKSKIKVCDANNSEGVYPFYTSGKSILKYQDYLVDGTNIFVNTGGIADIKMYIGKSHYSTDTWCIKGIQQYTLFLYSYLCSITDEIQSSYFEGAALKHLKKQSFKKKKILVPPLCIVEQYNKHVEPIYQLISKLLIEIENLKEQRDLLLPRLMSGKLEVKA